MSVGVGLSRPESFQGSPARVHDLARPLFSVVRQLLAGLGVEAGAVVATHGLERKRKHNRVPNYGFTIHVIIVNRVVDSVLRRIREKLLEFDFEGPRDGIEAPHALPRLGRVDLPCDKNPVVQTLKTQLNGNGRPFRDVRRAHPQLLGGGELKGAFPHFAGAMHEVARGDAVRRGRGRHSR